VVEAKRKPEIQVDMVVTPAEAHAYVQVRASMALVMASAFDSVCPVLLASCHPNVSLAAGDLCLIAATEMVK